MKNKFCYILLGLLVNFSFVNSVFAEGLEFSMTATANNNEIVVGEQGTITVNLKSDSVISSCQFNVTGDTNLEFVSNSGLNNWNFGTDEGSTFTINNNSSDNVAYTDGKNIFNLVYQVNGNGKVTIKDIQCTSSTTGDGGSDITGTTSDMEVSFTTKEVVDDTSLSSLTVTGGTLLTEFSPNTYEYMIELDDANFSINMTASNSEYQDKIVITNASGQTISPNNITYTNDGGQNFMRMTVTINGNTSKQYVLIAHYEQKELDNSLGSLKINGTEIKLSADKVDYTFTIGKNVNEVSVVAALKDSTNFQFREGNEPGIYQVSSGTTSIALMIVPKSSQTGAEAKTYYIDIIKEGTSNNNNNNGNNNNSSNNGNATTNPSTGNVSMFIMAIILISSLVGSIFLYQKNLESYK